MPLLPSQRHLPGMGPAPTKRASGRATGTLIHDEGGKPAEGLPVHLIRRTSPTLRTASPAQVTYRPNRVPKDRRNGSP